MSAQYDIGVEINASWRLSIQWPRFAPNDLSTGWTAKAQVRAKPEDTTALVILDPFITLSAGSNGTVSAPGLPNIVIAPPFDAFNGLSDNGVYYWDLLLIRTVDAFHKYLLNGRVYPTRRISR